MSDRLHVTVPYGRLRRISPLASGEEASTGGRLWGSGARPPRHELPEGRRRDPCRTRVSASPSTAPITTSTPGPWNPWCIGSPGSASPDPGRRRDPESPLVVFHPGFDPWKYGGQDDLWVKRNLEFWPPLLEQAAEAGCPMALENIFEEAPITLRELLTRLDSPWLGHCFDVGHWNLFGRVSLAEWIRRPRSASVSPAPARQLGKP